MQRGRSYRQKEQRRGSFSRLRTQSNRRRSRSDQRQSRSRQGQLRRRPRQLQLNDFMPPQLRDTSPTATMYLPNQFNLGEAATTATIQLLQRHYYNVNILESTMLHNHLQLVKMKKIIKINHHHHYKYHDSNEQRRHRHSDVDNVEEDNNNIVKLIIIIIDLLFYLITMMIMI